MVEAPRFHDNRHVNLVRLSAYVPAAFISQEVLLVLISVRGWKDPRAIVRPEGLRRWKREFERARYKNSSVTATRDVMPIVMGQVVAWRSWLRHCATSWKVAGSVSCGVTGNFHWLYSSDCPMTVGLTQKWVPGISPGGKGGRSIGLATLPRWCADCHEIRKSEPPGLYRGCFALFHQ